MDIIQDYLKSIVAMIDREPPEGYKYKCTHEFVLEHGKPYRARPLPEVYKRGTIKQCYKNSFLLSLETDLTYVEGFADNIIPVSHAWCVDRDGNVIDPTWPNPENCEYFGIPFKQEYVISNIMKDGYLISLIDNWQDGFPVFQQPPEMWKA